MYSLVETRLECNNRLKLNFDGGDLSSDTGLFLIKEFIHKIGFDKVIRNIFKTNDSATFRIDKDADEFTNDPVFSTILDKNTLTS